MKRSDELTPRQMEVIMRLQSRIILFEEISERITKKFTNPIDENDCPNFMKIDFPDLCVTAEVLQFQIEECLSEFRKNLEKMTRSNIV